MMQKSKFKILRLGAVKICLEHNTSDTSESGCFENKCHNVHVFLPCPPDVLLLPAAAPDPCLCKCKNNKTEKVNKIEISLQSTFSSSLNPPDFGTANRRLPTILSSHPNELNMHHCSVPFTN